MPIIEGPASAAGLGSTCDPWATIADVGSPCSAYDFDQVLLEETLQIASDVLYNFTGRQWPGQCQTTVRPCGYRQPDSCGCLSSTTCACSRLSELDLPGSVVSIDQVKIDGVVVSSDRYRVDDYRHLVYLPEDGGDRDGWPCCQRLDLADTEDDTWSVTYTYGQDPPLGGLRSAASLGCQLALAFDPTTSASCRLPKRVTSLSRQGISMAILDPLTLFAEGLTGLTEVDMWVQSTIVGAKRRRASVWVPELQKHGLRVTDT
jgi:hypothetical protein